MDVMAFIRENPAIVIMVLNGLVAGWLAGLLLGGGGLIRNLIVGIIGGWMVSNGFLTLPYNFDTWIPYGNQIAVSTVGALLVVIIARFLGGR